jgi:hypothetical protein
MTYTGHTSNFGTFEPPVDFTIPEHESYKATHVPHGIAAAVLRRTCSRRDLQRGACPAAPRRCCRRQRRPECVRASASATAAVARRCCRRQRRPECVRASASATAAVARRCCRRQRPPECVRASASATAAVARRCCGHHHRCAWRRPCGAPPVHVPRVRARASADARAVCLCASEHAGGRHVVARQAHPPQVWRVRCVHGQDLRLQYEHTQVLHRVRGTCPLHVASVSCV